ncbi:MAG: Gfo/Idh/MocA family oxidoreductase [Trueperaceae bacterium]|nr:MAG: Gfo/Idh/MocA family oxidoreductase [Trueperaceae bacterium]
MAISAQVAIGIIGVGGMGGRHARNIHRHVVGAEVAAVSDVDLERVEQIASECGAQVFADPFELIDAAEIDAVLIASPDPTHAELTLACLSQKKPVLCEKPLAVSAVEAARVVDSELALGRKLVSVGFMRRFDPQHLAVRRAIGSGQLGRPFLFKGVHRNAEVAPNATTEMVVTNSAVHDIDSARWLMSQEVEEIFVKGVKIDPATPGEALDGVVLHLGLTGDCLASLEVSVSVGYGYEVSAEVVSSRGAAVTAQPAAAVLRSRAVRSLEVAEDWLVRFQEAYLAELNAWVSSLTGASFDGASAWDGYLSLLIADAGMASLASGQPEPVVTPPRPELYT